jgi:hypothetical protein
LFLSISLIRSSRFIFLALNAVVVILLVIVILA